MTYWAPQNIIYISSLLLKAYKLTFIGKNAIDSDEEANGMNKSGGIYGREQLLSREQQRRWK